MMTEEQRKIIIDTCNVMIARDDSYEYSHNLRMVAETALAALTQPASPALKLPDEMDADHPRMRWVGMDELWGRIQGWNDCLEEVKRLNAPPTAPIEPICATGGAEWVKVPKQMTPEMIKAVQQNTEIGSYIAGNWAGAYALFDEFYESALAAAPEEG